MEMELNVKFKEIKRIDFGRTFKNLVFWDDKGMKADLKWHIRNRKQVDGTKVRDNSIDWSLKKGFNHWGFYTGQYINNAFVGKSKKDYAEIQLSKKNRKKNLTYEGLAFLLNDKRNAKQFGITKRIKKFVNSRTFKKWLAFDVKRAIDRARVKHFRKKI